jgi:hypothetical protein
MSLDGVSYMTSGVFNQQLLAQHYSKLMHLYFCQLYPELSRMGKFFGDDGGKCSRGPDVTGSTLRL